MLNNTGRTGKMFGKDITFFENKKGNIALLILVCGDMREIIETNKTAEEYIDCPYYVREKHKLVFNKPRLYYVPEYEFMGDIGKTDVVKNYIFGKYYGEFEFAFGSDYLTTGRIVKARGPDIAIKYWNTAKIINKRLEIVILNYIIENDIEKISLFVNRPVDIYLYPICYPVQADTRKVFRCCKYVSKQGIYNKNIFGPFRSIFKNNITNGIYFANEVGSRCFCKCRFSTDPTMENGLVYHTNWAVYYDELVYEDNKIFLRKPVPFEIRGAPWKLKHDNISINGTRCYSELMRDRGGEIYKKINTKGTIKLDFDVTKHIEFVYNRCVDITGIDMAKAELIIAKKVGDGEYTKYILNFMAENNLYYYYKFINQL